MKKRIITRLLGYGLLLLTTSCSTTQPVTTADLQNAITGRQWIFRARTALPLRGQQVNLNSDYDLQVRGDSLIVYLPYFGRAYTAPVDPTQGGLHFTSTKFEYAVTGGRRWNIRLRPQGNNEVRELTLQVEDNGAATLQVMSSNRDPIAFRGEVEPKK